MGQIIFGSGQRLGKTPGAFIIAEAGVNHNGDMKLGLGLIDAAADAGADAIKFQTFSAKRLVAPSAPKAQYQETSGPEGESQAEMLKKLELSKAQHALLRDHAQQRGIMFMSSPFDEESVDLLVELGVEALKLGSGEVTNTPLLEHAASKGLPLILSTGMSTLAEVDHAVQVVRRAGGAALALMHCVSLYPTPVEYSNLKAMDVLKCAYQAIPVGFSDHTQGLAVSVAAVARGALIVEKHLTLDCSLPGPDHAASLEPHDFASLVSMIRQVEAALGHGRKEPMPGEEEMRFVARRSLHVARDLQKGDALTRDAIEVWRPSHGLPTHELPQVLGRKVSRAIKAGEPLTWDDLT